MSPFPSHPLFPHPKPGQMATDGGSTEKLNRAHLPRRLGSEIRHLMHNIVFEITDDETDELMDEIQDSSGTVDYKKLTKLIFEKLDTQQKDRANYKTRMAEIKAYFANNPNKLEAQ